MFSAKLKKGKRPSGAYYRKVRKEFLKIVTPPLSLVQIKRPASIFPSPYSNTTDDIVAGPSSSSSQSQVLDETETFPILSDLSDSEGENGIRKTY